MIQIINKKENIFEDGIAFVENWDFSKANLNEENRILAITQVASICYQSPKQTYGRISRFTLFFF
jgi:thymidylate synthase (FAD)